MNYRPIIFGAVLAAPLLLVLGETRPSQDRLSMEEIRRNVASIERNTANIENLERRTKTLEDYVLRHEASVTQLGLQRLQALETTVSSHDWILRTLVVAFLSLVVSSCLGIGTWLFRRYRNGTRPNAS